MAFTMPPPGTDLPPELEEIVQQSMKRFKETYPLVVPMFGQQFEAEVRRVVMDSTEALRRFWDVPSF